jgi:hypothetical protein
MFESLCVARKFHGRHSRDLSAGIHGCLALEARRLEVRFRGHDDSLGA